MVLKLGPLFSDFASTRYKKFGDDLFAETLDVRVHRVTAEGVPQDLRIEDTDGNVSSGLYNCWADLVQSLAEVPEPLRVFVSLPTMTVVNERHINVDALIYYASPVASVLDR